MFHKKLTGRLLAGVLSVITIFCSMPVTAFADEDIIISEDNNQENAALEENSVEALKEDILETENVLEDNVRSNGALESGQDGFSWILDTDGTLTISVDTDIVADGTDSCEMVKNDKNGAKPKVEVRFRGKTLTEGVDYSVSYKNNKTFAAPDPLQLNKAPAVIIAGKGCFKGKIIKYFTITEKLP